MNLLDGLFLVLILVSVLMGVIKGFIRELLSLAFFIIAVVLAFLFYHDVGTLLMKNIESRNVANFAGFTAVFAGVLIVGSVVTFLVKKAFNIGPLKGIDRILGSVFGLLRGMLICGIILFGLIVFPVDDNLVTDSRLSPFVLDTLQIFYKLLPGKLQEKVNIFNREQMLQNQKNPKGSKSG